MSVNVLYYGGHTAAAATATGGGGGGSATIQTIIKEGVLKMEPFATGGQSILPTDEQQIGLCVALFPDGIPSGDYELFFNGQWHTKGQMGEVKKSSTRFEFPTLPPWHKSDILEMKYQIIV
jgi:hypothetical protein